MWNPFVSKPRPDLWKGLAAGVVGGLAGTLAMTGFQYAWKSFGNRSSGDGAGANESERHIRLTSHPAAQEERRGEPRELRENETNEPPPTVKVAEAVSKRMGAHLSDSRKRIAGSAVHYGYGTVLGGAYGALAEYVPELTRADGLAFGAGVMLVSDEIALPALRLTPPPTETPLSSHLYGFTAHLVYGAVCELTRRGVRRFIA